MKKFILSFIMIICACTFVFAGCGAKGLTDNPATDANITGNGGYAIRKGDYLYYVNGFVDDYATELDDYKKDNVEGKVVYGAIYRTKLVDNNFRKDEKGFLEKSERVVSKVVGYDNGGFYIVGDYIYYATPYMNVDKNGVIQNNRISFNRIKIDGTGNKEFYVTDASASELDWSIKVIDGKVYLVVKQTVTTGENVTSTQIVSIVDNGKKFKQILCADNVKDFVMDEDVNLTNEYFFYTRQVNAEDDDKYTTTGTLVIKSSLVTGEKTIYELDKTSEFKPVKLDNERLYMTMPKINKTYLYSYNVYESLVNQNPIQLSNDTYTTYYTIEGVPHSVIAVGSDNSVIKLSNVNGKVVATAICDSLSGIIKVDEGYVYSYESNILYRTSIEDGSKVTVSGVGEAKDKTFLIDSADMVDIDGRYVYVYAKYTAADGSTTSYYLNRIDTMQSEMIAEFVGVMTDSHMVADPEKVEEENEEDEEVETDEVKPWIY